MLTALQLAADNPILADAVRRSRRILNRRALVGAAASTVPVPGLDWAVDAALLSRLIPAINAEFGLTPAQLDQLPAHKREQVQKALAMVGSVLVEEVASALAANEPVASRVLAKVKALGDAVRGARVSETV